MAFWKSLHLAPRIYVNNASIKLPISFAFNQIMAVVFFILSFSNQYFEFIFDLNQFSTSEKNELALERNGKAEKGNFTVENKLMLQIFFVQFIYVLRNIVISSTAPIKVCPINLLL